MSKLYEKIIHACATNPQILLYLFYIHVATPAGLDTDEFFNQLERFARRFEKEAKKHGIAIEGE